MTPRQAFSGKKSKLIWEKPTALHCAFLKQQRKDLGIKRSQLPNMAFLQMAEEITLSEYIGKEKVRLIQVHYVHYEILKNKFNKTY